MQLGAKAHCANIYPYPIYFVNTYPSYPFITPAKEEMLCKRLHFGIRNFCRNSFKKFNQLYSFKVIGKFKRRYCCKLKLKN